MNNNNKAFTLAEVMITLAVIGIITAIVMPIMVNSAPDKKIMKFKKGNATLARVITELVNSGDYYADGELGRKKGGDWVISGDYFCSTFADVISAKSSKCEDGDKGMASLISSSAGYGAYGDLQAYGDLAKYKQSIDVACKKAAVKMGEEIVAADGVVYYEAAYAPFGIKIKDYYSGIDSVKDDPAYQSENRAFYTKGLPGYGYEGMYIVYKTFCMDVDGISSKATASDCGNECPFGYGIRVDGKILPGKRADEWLEKDFNGKDPSEQ